MIKFKKCKNIIRSYNDNTALCFVYRIKSYYELLWQFFLKIILYELKKQIYINNLLEYII